MKKKIISIINLGIILNWLSIFFSYKKLDNQDIHEPIATGGFPLKIFSYPFPPMGHDWPPAEVWPIFFLNFIIWTIIAVFIVLLLGKKIKIHKFSVLIASLAVLLSIFGIFYLILKFD